MSQTTQNARAQPHLHSQSTVKPSSAPVTCQVPQMTILVVARGFAVPQEPRCPKWGQICKDACGKLLVTFKTDEIQKKKVNDRFRHHCRITLLQLVLPSTSTPWAMASSGTLGEGCQILGEGGWDADGRRSLWAYFSTPGPAGQDWLHHSESGISRCYWCGTGIIHSACCRCREIPQMASFFKTPLPKSFKTKLAISVCIDAPFLLLIFALYLYWCEEQAAAIVAPAHGRKEIIFRNPVNGGGSLFCSGFDFCFALLLLLYLTSK